VSDNRLSAADPKKTRPKSWSELAKGEKVAVIAILAVPLFCCIGVVNMVDDDGESRTPGDGASEIVTVATESPTELDPSTTRPAPTEAATTEAAVAEVEETEEAAEVAYDNCSEAEDAGVTPLYAGDPGYADHLDRDGDGVACESGSSDPEPEPEPEEPSDEDEDDGGEVYYENCDAARAAGAAPVHAGDPGYGSHLDRDGDGVGCE
jgi:type IV secretory pathway VirB10-like protein